MELMPKTWQGLPTELVDLVLGYLTELHSNDPAYQWTTLRHVSSSQFCQIEKLFISKWVPKLTVTLYHGAWKQMDYTCGEETPVCDGNMVSFEKITHRSPNEIGQEQVIDLWKHYSFESRVAHLRLGECCLNRGIRGGHIVNDTELVGLKVADNGMALSFDWKGTMNALLREEMMVRKIQKDMVSQRIRELKVADQWPSSPAQQRRELIKQLTLDIQMRKWVVMQKHRLRRHDPAGSTKLGSFCAASAHLHKQVVPPSSKRPTSGCCFICNQDSGPSIFEVVSQEESVVLALDGWQQLDKKELHEMYAEAFGWSCCRCQRKEDNVGIQQTRSSQWFHADTEYMIFDEYPVRWDALG